MGEARPQQSKVLLRELLPSRAVPCRLATGRESQSRWLCRLPQLMQAPLCVVLIPVLDVPVLCPPLQLEALLGTQLIAQNSVVLSRWGTKYRPVGSFPRCHHIPGASPLFPNQETAPTWCRFGQTTHWRR